MQLHHTWTVSARLYAALALGALVVLGSLALGYAQMRRGQDLLGAITEVDFRHLQEVNDWQVVSTGTTVRIMALNRTADPAIAQLFGPEIEPRIRQIDKHLASIKTWATSDSEKAALRAIDESGPMIIAALAKIAERRQTGDEQGAQQAFQQGFMPAVTRYHEAVDGFASLQHRRVAEAAQAAEAEQARAFWTGTISALVLLVGVGCLVHAQTRTIQRSLNRAVRVAEAVAEGDLTVTVGEQRTDEFGQLMSALDRMASRPARGGVAGAPRHRPDSEWLASDRPGQSGTLGPHRTPSQQPATGRCHDG